MKNSIQVCFFEKVYSLKATTPFLYNKRFDKQILIYNHMILINKNDDGSLIISDSFTNKIEFEAI